MANVRVATRSNVHVGRTASPLYGTPAAAESRPAPTDQRAVPAQDRGRLHQEQGARRKLAAECGQDHAIGCPPLRPSSGASQDEQLLAEDEEFEIAIGSLATPDDDQVNQKAEEGKEQGQQHGAASVGPARGAGQAAGRSPAEQSAPGWEVRPLPRSGRAVGDHTPPGAGYGQRGGRLNAPHDVPPSSSRLPRNYTPSS